MTYREYKEKFGFAQPAEPAPKAKTKPVEPKAETEPAAEPAEPAPKAKARK